MLINNKLYMEDVDKVVDSDINWGKLNGKTVMISGATGMIGSFLIDVIMRKNMQGAISGTDGFRCFVIALGRSLDKGRERFEQYIDDDDALFEFVRCDVNATDCKKSIAIAMQASLRYYNFLNPDSNINNDANEELEEDKDGDGLPDMHIDYILHLASSTHPLAYSTEPIKTITTNIIAANSLLEFATIHNCTRFVYASSVEVYGENRGDVDSFNEEYLGYINSNTLRAGYPESKRAGEALCQAYRKEKGLDIVIPRFSRTYGPSMLMSDTKAISQFIKKSVDGEDIVLKSEGNQFYSYSYVADAVSGLIYIMTAGIDGEAYNIADSMSDISLKELAMIAASAANENKEADEVTDVNVVFELPDQAEKAGYSIATRATLDSAKLKKLGWKAMYGIDTGIRRTVKILKALR